MRNHLTITTKANELRLLFRHPSSRGILWVLVEGISDVKLLTKFIDNPSVRVEESHGGKPDLRKGMEELRKDSSRFLGVADADFEWLASEKADDWDSVLRTDWHDFEMSMILNDTSFKACLSEACPSQLSNFEELRNHAISCSDIVGCLRYYNFIQNAEFNFKGLKVRNVWDFLASCICSKKLCDEVNVLSTSNESKAELLNIESIKSLKIDSRHLSSGHDLVNTIAHLIRETGAAVSGKSLESFLRVGYSLEQFKETGLGTSLFAWIKTETERVGFLELK